MPSLSAISLSGMNAARRALDASAHNIANLATDGFRREQAVHATAASGGVISSFARSTQVGSALETDVIGQMVARNAFLANFAVFKTGDQMLGSLLDARR